MPPPPPPIGNTWIRRRDFTIRFVSQKEAEAEVEAEAGAAAPMNRPVGALARTFNFSFYFYFYFCALCRRATKMCSCAVELSRRLMMMMIVVVGSQIISLVRLFVSMARVRLVPPPLLQL